VFTLAFAKAAAERALKTAAQTALSYFVIGTTGILDLDWAALASVSGAAAIASVLTSIVSSGVGGDGPSLAGEKIDDDPKHAA
jgi:hypothetical protein